jgi:hypothetical protein
MFGRAIAAGTIATVLAGLGAVAVAAAAESAEQAEALLFGGAINRFVARQLPSTFAVRGDRDAGIGAQDVTLVDARYCGAARDVGRGRFIGVLRPTDGGGTAALPAIEDRDCRGKLDDVARRLAAAPDADAGAVAVVELIAAWAPSELRVSIGDVAPGGEAGRALGRTLARAKVAGPLATADTSGLHLQTEHGSSLAFDLALTFLKGGDGVLATLTPACPGCAPPAPHAPSVIQGAAPADSDGAVGATLPLANRVVALFSADGPLVLELDRQTVEIRNVQISGGDGALVVRGRATAREVGESALVRIDSAGADLRLGSVAAEAEPEDCSALSGAASLRCSLRNRARGPAAAALAAAMTARTRGQLLRAMIPAPPFSFDLGNGGRRLTLRLTPTRAAATATGIVVNGKVDLE